MRAQTRLYLFLIVFSWVDSKPRGSAVSGPGFAFSGAGGRLAQHLAMVEALVRGFSPSGQKVIPAFISGASSGAISAVALNAILETQERNLSKGFSWDTYKALIFSLQSSDIYDNSDLGIAKILTYNIFKGYFLDNSRLRDYLAPYFQQMGYSKLGDLYLPTSVTLVDQTTGLNYRLWSTDPQYADLDLLDVVMATTALPLAFPTRQVDGLGDTIWIDGGTGIDTLPVYPLIHQQNVTSVYLVCYSSALKSGGADLPSYLADIYLLYNAIATIDDMRVDLFEGAIEMASKAPIPAFTYIPNLNQSFSSLDFDHEELEYNLAHTWALAHDPSPVNQILKYLRRNNRL